VLCLFVCLFTCLFCLLACLLASCIRKRAHLVIYFEGSLEIVYQSEVNVVLYKKALFYAVVVFLKKWLEIESDIAISKRGLNEC
jgi:hypothetical protein